VAFFVAVPWPDDVLFAGAVCPAGGGTVAPTGPIGFTGCAWLFACAETHNNPARAGTRAIPAICLTNEVFLVATMPRFIANVLRLFV
jgi:hypothetical protein